MEAHPIHELHRGSDGYPEQLRALSDAPRTLYYRGHIDALSPLCIAVVGTRMMTDYGRQATQHITGTLARSRITIVSGLALGVDAIAHRTAIDAGGRTIAVLGSGVDDATIGPRQNVPLARDILNAGGLIMSEYPEGTPANKWTFPARNRIISGISRGVVVTEAAMKSGALITARLAADQGRDVYAVPGSIFWPRSAGPNYLIQYGATAITGADDILRSCGIEPAAARVVSTQNDVQQGIADILDDGPAHMDAIVSASGRPAADIMAALSLMELSGSIINMQNGYYRKS